MRGDYMLNQSNELKLIGIIAACHTCHTCSYSYTKQGITYLGTEWAHNPIVRRDVPVSRLLKTLGAERHPERCSRLLDIMDVNVDWHMHAISDGQRREYSFFFICL
jgi:ABC-type uncharacterized transport system ATPase subunit